MAKTLSVLVRLWNRTPVALGTFLKATMISLSLSFGCQIDTQSYNRDTNALRYKYEREAIKQEHLALQYEFLATDIDQSLIQYQQDTTSDIYKNLIETRDTARKNADTARKKADIARQQRQN